jgi:hypothetical protein
MSISTCNHRIPPGGHGPHPPGGSRHPLIGAALALACACSSNPSAPPANPIDRILVPKLAEQGLEARSPEPYQLCRRIAIDLLGRGPSPDELAACVAAGDAERVELAQAHPDYLRTTRRVWSELLGFNAYLGWSKDVAALDQTVTDLAAGRIDYRQFATRVVTHPGFIGLHPYDEWAQATIAVFLGRPAREDEVAALRPLSAAWYVRYLCEGGMWWTMYTDYLEEGYSEHQAALEADYDCADDSKPQVGFNPCMCRPDDGLLGCHSTAFGDPVDLPVRCEDKGRPYGPGNVFLLGDAPGGDDTCPDGSHRPNCADRETANFIRLDEPNEWMKLDDQARGDLDRIGAALTARPDFWEAAADRVLRRLLGWWQISFRHPDTDLPEVRALLAGLLREGTSLAEVERLVMTSQLYLAPAEPPSGWDGDGDPPPWAMGPTKLLAAEAWMDTLLLAVGERPGACDVRAISTEGYTPYYTDPRGLEDPASSLDAVSGEWYYVTAVGELGGCKAGTPRPTQSSVGLVFAQGEHARLACAYGEGVVPQGGAGDLRAAARRLVERLWARPAADGEIDELVAEMEACLAAGAGDDQACTDPEYAVRWLCQRLADSTEFATY